MKEQQVYNLKIAYELLDFILEHPEIRFMQALWCIGLGVPKSESTDRFFEPSEVTYEKMKKKENRKESKCLTARDFQGRLKNS